MTVNSDRKKTLLILCSTEFFSCFAFFGMISLLILFFVKDMQFSEKFSYSLLANFGALSYITALIGGFLGGQYLTFRISCLLGLILLALGYFILMLNQHMICLYAGLALVACAGGLLEPNIRSLLGIHYNQRTPQERNTGFIVLHVFNVCGQVAGPIVLTYLRRIDPSWMFAASGVACLFGAGIFLSNYRHIASFSTSESTKTPISICKGVLGIIILLVLVFFILYKRDVRYVLETAFIGVFIAFAVTLPRMEYAVRVRIITIFLILIGLVMAEICFRQGFGVINLFTSVYVNRTVFNTILPTGIFQSAEPFFILLAFMWILKLRERLDTKGFALSAGTSVSFGLLGLGVSFGFLVLGIFFSMGLKMSVSWLMLSYAAMAIAELFIIPIAMAATTALSPQNLRGVMMGILFLTGGLSSYLSGHIGKLISPQTGNPTVDTYKNLFLILTCFALIGSFGLYLIWKYWQKKHVAELPEKI